MWYVVVLIWIALVAGIVWAYNKKQRQRGAERAKQIDTLLSELKAGTTPATAPSIEGPARAAAGAAVAAPVADLSKKPRVLPQAQALLYYVFRAGLPDHEIFAGLALGDVVEVTPAVSGYEREQKLRRIAQQRLDLVVCTKQLEIVAAVVVDQGLDRARAENARFVEECLRTAGIRLVRIDPAAPPRHHRVRELIYGATV